MDPACWCQGGVEFHSIIYDIHMRHPYAYVSGTAQTFKAISYTPENPNRDCKRYNVGITQPVQLVEMRLLGLDKMTVLCDPASSADGNIVVY